MAKTSTFLKDKDKVAVEEKFTMRKERAVIYKQGQSEEGTQSSHSPTADIMGCEVKRTLRSITMTKASGGDGIPVELFQILKDVKVLHSICQQIWKTQQWPQDWKRSISIPIPKKGNAKECSKYHTIAFISHASKVKLKILQARLQQYMNHELPDVQAKF